MDQALTWTTRGNAAQAVESGWVVDDGDLVARARSGDPVAFERLYEQYHAPILNYLHRMVSDRALAEDLTQDTFEKAYKALPSTRPDLAFKAWLYRIATNESLTFLEQRKKRTAISMDQAEAGLSNSIKADKHFDANRLEWKLQLAIQQLPEKQRAVFNLRYYDEMPYEQMSRVLETSEGALKASYHHAVKKIEDYILNR